MIGWAILSQPMMREESFSEFSHDNLYENCIFELEKYASNEHKIFRAYINISE